MNINNVLSLLEVISREGLNDVPEFGYESLFLTTSAAGHINDAIRDIKDLLSGPTPELSPVEQRMVDKGEKIKAIKFYRARTKEKLKRAKRAVEKYIKEKNVHS